MLSDPFLSIKHTNFCTKTSCTYIYGYVFYFTQSERSFSSWKIRSKGTQEANYIIRVKTTDGLINGVDFSEFPTEFAELQNNDNLMTHLNKHREKVDLLVKINLFL